MSREAACTWAGDGGQAEAACALPWGGTVFGEGGASCLEGFCICRGDVAELGGYMGLRNSRQLAFVDVGLRQ